jgi:hypothetical protein
VSGYSFTTLDAIPEVPTATDPGDPAWKPIQHHLGLTAFGINAYTARAVGDALASEHDEASFGQEEVYVVLAGRVRFTVAGESFDAGPGGVLAVRDPALSRAAEALEPGATVVAVGCRPGCFETSWQPRHFQGLPRHPSAQG